MYGLHAVSREDREMRVVLEQAGGSIDGIGLDDNVAAERVHGVGDAVLETRVVLPTMPPRSGKKCGISLSSQSVHCL